MEIDPVLRFVVIEIDGQRVGVAAIAYDTASVPRFSVLRRLTHSSSESACLKRRMCVSSVLFHIVQLGLDPEITVGENHAL